MARTPAKGTGMFHDKLEITADIQYAGVRRGLGRRFFIAR
jgi:hypothetical protein